MLLLRASTRPSVPRLYVVVSSVVSLLIVAPGASQRPLWRSVRCSCAVVCLYACFYFVAPGGFWRLAAHASMLCLSWLNVGHPVSTALFFAINQPTGGPTGVYGRETPGTPPIFARHPGDTRQFFGTPGLDRPIFRH